LVYDIFGEYYQRKLDKGSSGDLAFDIDLDGRVLIYSIGSELILHSLKIPDPLHKHLRPRYNLALHKENPAKIASQRMAFIEKISKSIKLFNTVMGKEVLEKKHGENCLLLMHKKMQQGFGYKRLINYNKEFLRL
jgi:hypothetical protein